LTLETPFVVAAVGPVVVLCADAKLAVAKRPPKKTAFKHLLVIVFILGTTSISTAEYNGVFSRCLLNRSGRFGFFWRGALPNGIAAGYTVILFFNGVHVLK
jgi:hypothetical protein